MIGLEFFVLASSIVAISCQNPISRSPPSLCMTNDQAIEVADFWIQLIGNYSTQLAEDVLTSNYTDYSESALSLNSVCPQTNGTAPPLTTPVFTSRQQFEKGQGSQSPIESEVLNVWNGCTEVTMRYNMTNLGSRPVIGVIAIETAAAPDGSQYPYQIQTTHSEFDSSAWVHNLQDSGKC